VPKSRRRRLAPRRPLVTIIKDLFGISNNPHFLFILLLPLYVC
jgi:hypothetical protein